MEFCAKTEKEVRLSCLTNIFWLSSNFKQPHFRDAFPEPTISYCSKLFAKIATIISLAAPTPPMQCDFAASFIKRERP